MNNELRGISDAHTIAHAHAAFSGLAIGDALGMPTQSMSRSQIAQDHGAITGFVAAGPHQLIAAGMPAGSITDDTEQAVLVAELLIRGEGHLDPVAFADALVEWEAAMTAKGSLDLLGPSTKAAVQRILNGVSVEEAGSTGTTNGAAMRITPIGIATPVDDLEALIDSVRDASRVTHDTGLGIAGAAAIAAGVSAGVTGATRSEALDVAVAAAHLGARRGHWVAGADIAAKASWARAFLPTVPSADRVDVIAQVIGTSVASQESVVAALALCSLDLDPWETLCLAASIGGDTDTIAAMAGAVLGAVHGPDAWPAGVADEVVRVNELPLDRLTTGLLSLRAAHAPGS